MIRAMMYDEGKEEWKQAVLRALFKKDDRTHCGNYKRNALPNWV